MLIHLTNIVLVLQTYIAAVKYEKYMEIKEKCESTKNALLEKNK